MVILMGVRLDRYNENKKKKSKRIYRFIKFIIVSSMLIGFGIAIAYVNGTIKDLNYLDNAVLFDINLEDRMFTIFGKSYIVEIDNILRFFKPD